MPRRAYLGWFHVGLCVTAVCFLLVLFTDVVALPRRTVFALAAGVSLISVTTFCATVTRGLWSAAGTYLAIFWMFHFGLIFLLGYSIIGEGDLEYFVAAWVLTDAAHNAAVLALIGLLSCVVGAYVVPRIRIRARRRDSLSNERDDTRVLTLLGAGTMIGAVGAWFAVVLLSGNVALLFASYTRYLAATAAYPRTIALVWLAMGIGAAALSAAPPSPLRRLGWIAFALFALVGFPLGLRGEILFPLAAAAVVRARNKGGLSLKASALIMIVGLLAISVVKNLRSSGLAEATTSEVTGGVWEGLAELGGSLQPVEKVVTWRVAGDDLMYGASYWAPIDRLLVYVIPGWTRVPADQDQRLLSHVVMRRAGAIGFSPVAEAYRNFAAVGVAVVMFIIGAVLGSLDRMRVTPRNNLLLAVIFVPLLIHVRNPFVSVPFQLLAGLLAFAFVTVLSRRRRRRNGNPQRPMTASASHDVV